MFWCDVDKAMIEKAGMDGTQRHNFISGNLHWPTGITIGDNLSITREITIIINQSCAYHTNDVSKFVLYSLKLFSKIYVYMSGGGDL